MSAEFAWHELYRAALLETDWMEIVERIQQAQSAIGERKRAIALDHGGTPEERHALAAALDGLAILQKEAGEWHRREQSRNSAR